MGKRTIAMVNRLGFNYPHKKHQSPWVADLVSIPEAHQCSMIFRKKRCVLERNHEGRCNNGEVSWEYTSASGRPTGVKKVTE